MLKKMLSYMMMISIVCLAIGSSTSVDADSLNYSDKYIRVGLEKVIGTQQTVKLEGNGFTVSLENEQAQKLFDVSGDVVSVKTNNFSHHIELTETFKNYSSALEKAENIKGLGESAYVFYNNGFRVSIGEFVNESSANGALEKIRNMTLDAVVSKNDTMISFKDKTGNTIIAFDENQRLAIKSQSTTTKASGKEFRGFLTFSANKSSLITINFIKLDDYIRGVVPREMGGSWHIEALKAQSVTARNFTLRNLNKHKSSGFDLCDSTHCQVYEGFNKEHVNSNKAIDETRNKLLKYNNEIAQTFYSSSSGGYTSSNENVWGGAAIPYLRGKKDPFSLGAPNSDWTYSISKSDASQKLRANGLDVGEISSFEFSKDEFGARVIELTVIGNKGTKVVSKEKIRNIFGTSNVKSTNYTIVGYDNSQVPIPTPKPPIEQVPEQPVPKPPVIEIPQVPVKPVPKPPVVEQPKPPIVVPPVDKSIEIYVLDSDKSYNSSMGNKTVITADGIKQLDKSLKNIVVSDGIESIVKIPTIKDAIVAFSNDIENANSRSSKGDTIIFKGSGWGHGVGMSQYGALAMAKEGRSYSDILEFYYSGAHVE